MTALIVLGFDKAAVFALVRRSTPDKVAEAVKQYHPRVPHTNLPRTGKRT